MAELDARSRDLLCALFSQLSFQIRGSLGSIHAALAHLVAEEEKEDAAQEKDAAALYHSYYQVLRLVGNLDLASQLLSHKQMELRNEDVVGLCYDVWEKTRDLTKQKGVEFSFRCDEESYPAAVNGKCLQRLLLNLISNALKATASGGSIGLRLKVTPKTLYITVSDTGCGISRQLQETLFDLPPARQYPHAAEQGLGLGLPICSWIAQQHGGVIAVSSREGQGTTVTVSLPNRRTDAACMEDVSFPDYLGASSRQDGFNPVLVELSDALTYTAFTPRHLD